VSIRRCLAIAALASSASLVALWAWAEEVDRRASTRWLGAAAQRTSTRRSQAGCNGAESRHIHAVIVLGYGNTGERANLVNRFRVRAGIRSLAPHADNLLILCGGPVHSSTSEAIIMQRFARDELGFPGEIALDTTSRSTWENIAHAIPLIEHADTISIVSNAPHAEIGRQILWHQRPDLAQRLVRGAEHRLGESPVLKILGSLRAAHAKRTGDWARSTRDRRARSATET